MYKFACLPLYIFLGYLFVLFVFFRGSNSGCLKTGKMDVGCLYIVFTYVYVCIQNFTVKMETTV